MVGLGAVQETEPLFFITKRLLQPVLRLLEPRDGRPICSAKSHQHIYPHRHSDGGETHNRGGFIPVEQETEKAQNQSERRGSEDGQPAKG
jgi:hypothetical protein